MTWSHTSLFCKKCSPLLLSPQDLGAFQYTTKVKKILLQPLPRSACKPSNTMPSVALRHMAPSWEGGRAVFLEDTGQDTYENLQCPLGLSFPSCDQAQR